jgi:hypothetical protein
LLGVGVGAGLGADAGGALVPAPVVAGGGAVVVTAVLSLLFHLPDQANAPMMIRTIMITPAIHAPVFPPGVGLRL